MVWLFFGMHICWHASLLLWVCSDGVSSEISLFLYEYLVTWIYFAMILDCYEYLLPPTSFALNIFGSFWYEYLLAWIFCGMRIFWYEYVLIWPLFAMSIFAMSLFCYEYLLEWVFFWYEYTLIWVSLDIEYSFWYGYSLVWVSSGMVFVLLSS